MFTYFRLEPDIGFRPDDKEFTDTVYRVKISEIVLAAIEDIVGSFLIRDSGMTFYCNDEITLTLSI